MPIGVSQRPSPANGTKSRPQVRSRISGAGRRKTTRRAREGDQQQEQPDEVGPATGRPQVSAAGRERADGGGEHEADGEVDREDGPPVGDGEDDRAEERAEDAPISWTAETTPSGTPRRSTG